jgi:hypothetical protein
VFAVCSDEWNLSLPSHAAAASTQLPSIDPLLRFHDEWGLKGNQITSGTDTSQTGNNNTLPYLPAFYQFLAMPNPIHWILPGIIYSPALVAPPQSTLEMLLEASQ